MPSIPFYTTDVFTQKQFGGNQLAVFPDARAIPESLMQPIAREFNFSETTFVLPPKNPKHTRSVRIFTPGGELQFAGHPTIGTAVVLASIGEIRLNGKETPIVLEEGVGPVPVTIKSENGKPGFTQLSVAKLPEFGPPPPSPKELARMVGLDPSDVLTGEFSAEAASCGTPFLFVPLKNRKALARASARADDFVAVLKGYWTENVFYFCNQPELPGSQYRARMFAPGIGVGEDPATGSAAVAFGGYLAKRDKRTDGTLRWVIEQGFEMGRPSILEVEVDKQAGKVTAARVGGHAVMVSKGEFSIP